MTSSIARPSGLPEVLSGATVVRTAVDVDDGAVVVAVVVVVVEMPSVDGAASETVEGGGSVARMGRVPSRAQDGTRTIKATAVQTR